MRGRHLEAGDALAKLGHELRDHRRGEAGLDDERLRIPRLDVLAEDLHPRPEDGRALALVTSAEQHARATPPRVDAELAGGARLADARLAGEERDAPAPAHGVVERDDELRHLLLATDELSALEALGKDRGVRLLGADLRERVLQLSRARRAIADGFREASHDERVERLRHVAVLLRRRRRVALQVVREHGRGVPGERRLARQHLVEKTADRVEVAPHLDLFAERLLGRHVRHGADDRAVGSLRHALRRGREAEVAELREAVRGQPHVRGLHVAMEDAARVRVCQRLADLAGDPHCVRDGEASALAALELLLERAAGHELAHEVRPSVLLPEVVDGDDARMVAEAGHRARLERHAREADGVHLVALQDAQRDLARERRVLRHVDALPCAFAEEPDDLITARAEGDGPLRRFAAFGDRRAADGLRRARGDQLEPFRDVREELVEEDDVRREPLRQSLHREQRDVDHRHVAAHLDAVAAEDVEHPADVAHGVELAERAAVDRRRECRHLGLVRGVVAHVAPRGLLVQDLRERAAVAGRHREDHASEGSALLRIELGDQPEVHQHDAAGRQETDVPGMRIGVDEAVDERRAADAADDRADHVRQVDPAARQLVLAEALDPLHGEDGLRRGGRERAREDVVVDFRDDRVLAEAAVALRLADEVELLLDRRAEFLDRARRGDQAERGRQPLEHPRPEREHRAVEDHLAADVRPPDLDRDVVARRAENRAMDLSDRARGHRRLVEVFVDLFERPAELLLDRASHEVERERRHLVLHRRELVEQRLREEVGAGREDLPDLDERRAEAVAEVEQRPARGSLTALGPLAAEADSLAQVDAERTNERDLDLQEPGKRAHPPHRLPGEHRRGGVPADR